ncbi:hypothetical protein C8F04DRAFT_1113527 [Mycena alexandri]|uniref:Uncharacterized protein n=1 Tax=Mycena alexandri TaxID=1745969 RepID=A0AAD6SM68_9AGAR|nr:hypothetical protein C8F04DRAFT_1113527 [Mycena alexandri]
MPFPFTFKLAVPGLNPFSSPVEASSPQVQPTFGFSPQSPGHSRSRPARPHNINERRPSPSPSLAAPLSRKRGWDPSLAEPSQSAATFASSSGYLDTPAKYREMVMHQDEFELEDMSASVSDLPPPAKRRRGLAGSIVSTAVSAALIGTAVGLTVYRLWRDRGKDSEPDQIPPPPYQKGEWNPVPLPPSQAIQITPPTPLITPRRRKVRHGASTASGTKRGQRLRPRNHGRASSPPSSGMSPSKSAFLPDSMEDDDAGAVEDQMDWIGDQLSMLIQEGQKALGREIVIKSDAREDEIDDGCGVWEEEEGGYDQEFGGPSSYKNSLSRSASPRQRKRPRNLTLAPPSYGSQSRPASLSPRAKRFEFTSASLPSSVSGTRWRSDAHAPGLDRGMSADSTNSGREEEESPELKESMARARARLMGMRGAG